MKVLVSAEWRIGSGKLDAATEQVERTVTIATENKVGLYVFAGGLASKGSPLAHHAGALAVDVARRLQSLGIPSLWIAGAADRVPDGLAGTTLAAVATSGFGEVVTEPELVTVEHCPLVVALPYGSYNPATWLRQNASHLKAAKRQPRVLAIGALPVGVNTARGELIFPAGECAKWFPNVSMMTGHHAEAEERQGVSLVGSLAGGEMMLLEMAA